jgi:hypothetical protein
VTRFRYGRTEEQEIREEFRLSSLESARERAVANLGMAMSQTSHKLALIRDRIAELEAMPWKDVVHIKREVMDGGHIQIWVSVDHVPVLDGGPSFEDGYHIDGLLKEGEYGTRCYLGAQRREALAFAQDVARERGLDLYFEGFRGQKVKIPEGIICWGLSS